MDETIFSQHGLEKLLNPSQAKKGSSNGDQTPNLDDTLYRNTVTNYFKDWPKNHLSMPSMKNSSNKSSELKKNDPVVASPTLPTSESVYDVHTNPESFPPIMETGASLEDIPSRQVSGLIIQLIKTLLDNSEFQDQLISELLRRKDFCEKMRTLLLKDLLSHSLKF